MKCESTHTLKFADQTFECRFYWEYIARDDDGPAELQLEDAEVELVMERRLITLFRETYVTLRENADELVRAVTVAQAPLLEHLANLARESAFEQVRD